MRRSFLKLTAAVCLVAAPAAAQAPQGGAQPAPAPAPENKVTKTATFGDWTMTCRQAPSQNSPQCELVQSLVITGQKAPFAQIAMGKPKADLPLQVSVVLPISVSFPSVVKLSTSEKDAHPTEIAWARCLPIGCFANMQIKEDLLKKWRSADGAGRVQFANGAGQNIQFPISFKGLSDGLDALSKEK